MVPVIGIILTGIFLFCNFVIVSLVQSLHTMNLFETRSISENRYTLSDNYRGIPEQELMNDIYKINSLKELYYGLENWDRGEYFLFSSPGLLMKVINKSSVTQMRYGYEEGMLFDENDIDEKNLVSVKQISLNKAVCEYYDLFISDGQKFTDSNYIYNEKYIPALLGAEYTALYQVGDIIPAEFYATEIPIMVVGILGTGEYIIHNDKIVILDRYVVTAAQQFPLPPPTHEDFFLQAAVSLDNINGQMQLYEGVGLRELVMFLESYQHKYGFEMIDLLEVPSHAINVLRALNNRNLPIFVVLTVILIVYVIIAIHFTMKSIIEKNKKYYAVTILCGKGLGCLVFDIFLQLFTLFLLAHCLAALLTCFFTNRQIEYNNIWVIVSFLVFISIYTLWMHIKKMPVWEIISTKG